MVSMASRRGFLRLSRVLPTSRVFTSGYVNTETILHFFIIKCFCQHIFCMTGTFVLQLFFSSRQFHQRKRQRERFNHYCYVHGGCQISSACWLPLFLFSILGFDRGNDKEKCKWREFWGWIISNPTLFVSWWIWLYFSICVNLRVLKQLTTC